MILAKTVKGYGLGETAEGRNDRASAEEADRRRSDEDPRSVRSCRSPTKSCTHIDFFRPAGGFAGDEVSARAQSRRMGGRCRRAGEADPDHRRRRSKLFHDALGGSRGREASTTAAFVSVLKSLMKHPEMGKLVVPIVPDEARTFGMESLFREYGIYASQGQRYKPVDSNMLLYYKEAQERPDSGRRHHRSGIDGVVHRRGHGVRQLRRADDSVLHLLFDVRIPARGRSDLGFRRFARQGLPDGRHGRPQHAARARACNTRTATVPMLASTVPTCAIYDPAYAYELAVIIQDGIRRMYQEMRRSLLLPHGLQRELRAAARCRKARACAKEFCGASTNIAPAANGPALAQLFGSGSILNEALRAQQILAERYQIATDVWSVTSYNELRREALEVERWNRLHPAEKPRDAVHRARA